jgi:branched-chain amino acid transport system permease protein
MKRSTLFFLVGAFLVFAVIQALISFGYLNDFWNTILRIGGVMAIVSLGLNLIYGFNGQFSLGQWGFYAIGAYASADITYRWLNNHTTLGLVVLLLGVVLCGAGILLLRKLLHLIRDLDPLSAFTMYLVAVILLAITSAFAGKVIEPAITGLFNSFPSNLSLQIIFFLSVIIGGLLAAEVSFLFGLPVLTLGSDYFGIATLGFTIIVKVLLDNTDTMFGLVEMKGARGMIGIPKIATWAWVFFFLLAVVLITRNLLHSSPGRAIVSVREDEIAAKAMGIDVANQKIMTFILGSFFAGLAGGLYAHINGFLSPANFNFIRSFDPLIIIVFGGLGSLTGTLVASFAWALILEGVLRLVLPPDFVTWRFVVYPILLILLMLLKPKGLFGDYEIPYLRQILPALRIKKSPETTAAFTPVNPEPSHRQEAKP